MANFDVALAKVLKKEGGYVNDPADKGGETYKGISRKFHGDNVMWTYIDRYKDECHGVNTEFKKKLDADKVIGNCVADIYRKSYWAPFALDRVSNQKVAEQVFDDAVNRGVGAACKLCCTLLGLPVSSKPTKKLLLALEML